MNQETNKLISAHAAQNGLYLGGAWIVADCLFLATLSQQNSFWSAMWIVGVALSLALTPILVRHFCTHITLLNMGSAWKLAWRTWTNASLVSALAHFIYFKFLDGGFIVQTYINILNQPLIVDQMTTMMSEQEINTLKEEMTNMAMSFPVIELTLNLLIMTLIAGLILTPLLAWIGLKKVV